MRAKPAQLILKSGEIFDGEAFGYTKEKVGELVFNTSMTGYQEIITDPSYDRQIITFTNPHIGNTGINIDDDFYNIDSQKLNLLISQCKKMEGPD